MPASWNRLLKTIVGIASITLIGVASAVLLFNIIPNQQRLAGPLKATAVFKPTSTPEAIQPPDTDCIGGDTTLENARKYAGFKLLAPTYVPDSLQLGAAILNRVFQRRDFQVILLYRNLMINTAEPYVTIDQRLMPTDNGPPRPDQKISPLMIRGIQGQLIEYTEPKPLPPGTLPPNPTLTAFAEGRITIIPQTPKPLLPCAWTVITTPISWTPTPVRTASARPVTATPTPRVWQPPPMLRWIENGVQIMAYGTYSREQLLKVAESLR